MPSTFLSLITHPSDTEAQHCDGGAGSLSAIDQSSIAAIQAVGIEVEYGLSPK
jgi:hypothetical protein